MANFGGSNQETSLQTKEFPGAYGYGDSSRLAKMLEGLVGGKTASPLQTSLEESILRPQYGATTASEGALLQSLSSLTNANAALRGLGPATPAALSQTLAPALIDLRQKDIQNKLGGVATVGGQELQRRGMDYQTLIELIGLAMPQVVAGQQTTGNRQGFNMGDLASLAQAGATLAPFICWVADELYGPNHYKTYFARYYASTTDNWFIRLYAKHGKKWAKWLKKHTWAKPIIKPIWDVMAFLGMYKMAYQEA